MTTIKTIVNSTGELTIKLVTLMIVASIYTACALLVIYSGIVICMKSATDWIKSKWRIRGEESE